MSISIAATHATEPQKPNIVLILADDMGYADIGVHGCKDIPTPNIDSLAMRGVRFTDAYANGSFCTPTRAALMSCRYQHRYGIEDLGGPLPAQANTLPQRLKAAGYMTGMVGKWHLGSGEGFTPVDRGFDEFFGFLGGGHQYIIQPTGQGRIQRADPAQSRTRQRAAVPDGRVRRGGCRLRRAAA